MPYQLACPDFLPDTDTAKDARVTRFALQVRLRCCCNQSVWVLPCENSDAQCIMLSAFHPCKCLHGRDMQLWDVTAVDGTVITLIIAHRDPTAACHPQACASSHRLHNRVH